MLAEREREKEWGYNLNSTFVFILIFPFLLSDQFCVSIEWTCCSRGHWNTFEWKRVAAPHKTAQAHRKPIEKPLRMSGGGGEENNKTRRLHLVTNESFLFTTGTTKSVILFNKLLLFKCVRRELYQPNSNFRFHSISELSFFHSFFRQCTITFATCIDSRTAQHTIQ